MSEKVKTRIRRAEWNKLSTSTQDRLLELTLYKSGTMRHFVIDTAPTVFILYGYGGPENLRGQRIGWAIYDHRTAWAMFYLSREYRGHGSANALMEAVISHTKTNKLPKPKVSDWNDTTFFFFRKYNGRVKHGDYEEIEKYHQRHYKWRKR